MPTIPKGQSRIDRISALTVQDLLLYLDKRREQLTALTTPCNGGIEEEALQWFQQKLVSDSQIIFRIAELADNAQQLSQSDPGFPPGMA